MQPAGLEPHSSDDQSRYATPGKTHNISKSKFAASKAVLPFVS
jgi:hypothetical protein